MRSKPYLLAGLAMDRLWAGLLLAIPPLCASPALAEPLDRMRLHLAELKLDLAEPDGMLARLSVADFAAARLAGLIGDPLSSMNGLPQLMNGGAVAEGLYRSLAGNGMQTETTLGVGFARIEALVGFGHALDSATIAVLSDIASAATALQFLADNYDQKATAANTLIIGSPGKMDLAWRDPYDLIRGMTGLGVIVRLAGHRVSLAHSQAADDVALGQWAPETAAPTEAAALLAQYHDGLLAGLDRVIPARATAVQLEMAGAAALRYDPVIAAMFENKSQAELQALFEQSAAEAMPAYLGIAVAEWANAAGETGAAMALNYFTDCAGAAAAQAIITQRWNTEPLFESGTASAAAQFGPLLSIYGGASVAGSGICTLAFATKPTWTDPSRETSFASRLFQSTASGQTPLLR